MFDCEWVGRVQRPKSLPQWLVRRVVLSYPWVVSEGSWIVVGLLCAVVWEAQHSNDGPDFGGAHKTQPSVDGVHRDLVINLSVFTRICSQNQVRDGGGYIGSSTKEMLPTRKSTLDGSSFE